MSVRTRMATVEDVESLFEIRTSVAQNHLSREQMDALGITAQVLNSAIKEGPCVWIAEVDERPVAFSMIDRDEGEVFAMFVRPAYENRGLGRLLMAAAEAELFRAHERIFLVTDGRQEIRANGFYQRLGWTVVARVDARDVRYEKRRPLA
ncbi:MULTISPECIES: GNAT family N-acetyltransferase [unclassified Pseudomonas]|uniref:GNAT family N-acetyltransferase n=1 Tax=unclassified Pseudomonas TaxID=196821 RepID=UPI000BA2F0B5|nr:MULTISPECIES: GNAT family N-acetyltransferase [unclassified Pseudomonas]QHD00585.1 GNAT family N-acetyltransferase [Pseudomonas sp. S04]QHF33070.1 GNAT family N-acetyltransferase [Pseudomonas sp. S19]